MRPRTGVILAALGVLILLAGWWFGPHGLPATQEVAGSGRLMFPGLTARLQDAERIAITHQGRTLVISRHGTRWGLDQRGGYPVQPQKLRTLLTALTELRLLRPLTADPKEAAVLGLGDPHAPHTSSDLVSVQDAAGHAIAALVVGQSQEMAGGTVPDQVFVRRPGEAQTWLAAGDLDVSAEPLAWLAADVMNIPHGRIAAVTVHRGATTLTFAVQNGKLRLMTPAAHPKLDPEKLTDLRQGLEELDFLDVQPDSAPVGAAIGSTVFTTTDGLTVTVHLFDDGTSVLGRFDVTGGGTATSEAERLQARVHGWTYRFDAWRTAWLVPSLADLTASPAKPTQ